MKLKPVTVLVALSAMVNGCGPADYEEDLGEATSELITSNYTADTSIFPNPERGFHTIYDILWDRTFPRNTSLGNTLVHSYIRLDNWRASDLPSSLLNDMRAGFSAIRNASLKVIPRFSYNFGPWPSCAPDASEYWIKRHISQVAPVLKENADVIAWLEAGFIGCWGEWHASTSNLEYDSAAKTRIVKDMLTLWPPRPLQIRYPKDLRMFGGSSAFTSAEKSRLGFHHDCIFASDPDDYNTWQRDVWPKTTTGIQDDKNYVAGTSVTAPTGGETCAISTRSHCSTALQEFSAQHWTNLNEDFNVDVLNIFKSEGCFSTIKRQLGYRFVITSATYANSISAGSTFSLEFNVKNDGWGRLYNPRPLFAVLHDSSRTYTFNLAEDMRAWAPGQTQTIRKSFALPKDMVAGTYNLSLWLPDEAANLRGNAKYSVRFANTNMWNSSKGYNTLSTSISVSASSDTTSSTGSGSGSISFEKWTSASGTSVSHIPLSQAPNSTGALTSFEAPTNVGDNYGLRVRGYVHPSTSGNHTFWIAGDDNVELWLSTDENPVNKKRVAYHTGWTNSREWNKYSTQKSALISLSAGKKYYVEALMKEGSGGDNLAVGWLKPGQSGTAPSEVISGSFLSPFVASTTTADNTNLIQNAGFESGALTPWVSWGGMYVTSGGAHSGSYKANLGCRTGGEQMVTIAPNTSYTLSAWGAVSGNGEWGAAGYKVFDAANSALTGDIYMTAFGMSYSQRSVTFTTASTAAKLRIQLWHECGASDMLVDSFSLVKN